MITLTPVLSHALFLLRNDLYLHLDEAVELVNVEPDWDTDTTESARKLVQDLVEVVRQIVAQHAENGHGSCRFCRNPAWPCPTIQAVHSVLRDPDREFVRLVQKCHAAQP